MRGEAPRPLLFALVVAALLGAAALLTLRQGADRGSHKAARPMVLPGALGERHSPVAAPGDLVLRYGEDLSARRPARPALVGARRAVEAAARRFLAAFLPYEVGGLDGGLARRLRASATERFAAQLLAAPPRPRAGAMPPRARLAGLAVSLEGSGVLAEGSLRRGGELESFTLRLERSGGRWLVAGAVE